MRVLSVFLGVLFVLVIGIMPVSAITWGEPDAVHVNVGAMVVDFPDICGDSPCALCSGTLIHPKVFLTAGHCTDALSAYGITMYWVNFDQNALEPTTMLEVSQVITHPKYYGGPQSNPHDVGALILAEPVTDLEPVNLPPEGFLDELRAAGKLRQGSMGAEFTVVGYGGTLAWPPPEITFEGLRQSAVSEYQTLLKAWLRTSQNHATGDGGTCGGDSGGPAFWADPDGTEILVGITSWGDTWCVATGFNYRVDIPETLDFIDAVIAIANLSQ